MNTKLKFTLSTLVLSGPLSAYAQDAAAKIAVAATNCASCPLPVPDGGPIIVTWFLIGTAVGSVIGLVAGIAVQSQLGKSANK